MRILHKLLKVTRHLETGKSQTAYAKTLFFAYKMLVFHVPILTMAKKRNDLFMRIAVLLPCYNEEAAIEKVVQDFKDTLPEAVIYVYDNNSEDGTAEVARRAGAIVSLEPRKGKGNVVRRMFSDIDADIYVMADGDGTYETQAAPRMIEKLIVENLDMVVGNRTDEDHHDVYRPGHRFGNRLLSDTVKYIFGQGLTDMLSGYRVFSRRFVKNFPANARGFEIETELNIHALHLRLPTGEVPTRYYKRAEGTDSKLSTYKDGILILRFIMFLFQDAKPLAFFGMVGAILALLSVATGLPVIWEYFETGLVPRFPTAILSTGLMLSALLCFICGLIMENVSRGRKDLNRLLYLQHPAPSSLGTFDAEAEDSQESQRLKA